MKLSNSESKDLVRGRLFNDKANLIKEHHNLRLAANLCLKRIPIDNKLISSVSVNVQRMVLKSSPVLRPLVVHVVREDFSGLVPSRNKRTKRTNRLESKAETAPVKRRCEGTKMENKENKVNSN